MCSLAVLSHAPRRSGSTIPTRATPESKRPGVFDARLTRVWPARPHLRFQCASATIRRSPVCRHMLGRLYQDTERGYSVIPALKVALQRANGTSTVLSARRTGPHHEHRSEGRPYLLDARGARQDLPAIPEAGHCAVACRGKERRCRAWNLWGKDHVGGNSRDRIG